MYLIGRHSPPPAGTVDLGSSDADADAGQRTGQWSSELRGERWWNWKVEIRVVVPRFRPRTCRDLRTGLYSFQQSFEWMISYFAINSITQIFIWEKESMNLSPMTLLSKFVASGASGMWLQCNNHRSEVVVRCAPAFNSSSTKWRHAETGFIESIMLCYGYGHSIEDTLLFCFQYNIDEVKAWKLD